MLDNKRVVITGGGRDFGQALSYWFSQEGATVDLCARSMDSAIATERMINERGGNSKAHKCDITDSESIRMFIETLKNDPKKIDVLVLSAAQWLEGDLTDASDEEIISTINSGLTGSILLTKALLPYLNSEEGADIIFMVSVCGIPFYFNSIAHPAFFAAKSGLSGFGLNLSYNLAKNNIRTVNIYPPDFEVTELFDFEKLNTGTNKDLLNGYSIWQTIKLLLQMPRNCHVNSITFQGPTREEMNNE